MEIEELVNNFSLAVIKQHEYTIQGDWRKSNKEVKKIDSLYSKIKESGKTALDKLITLVESDIPEVACLAAVYCMRLDSNKCLKKLEELSKENIPHISFAAKHAIENWKNGEWYID